MTETPLPSTVPPPAKTEVVETIKSETVVKGNKPLNTESTVFGVSVRGWIALLLLGTMCGMAIMGKPVTEPLYSACIAALGLYFGHTKPK